ncbi:MAG: rod-binding protein [Lachnospiraceae bacterium]|nr:rod-binding protein [Lachnospiraceae bacterium]
MDLSTDYLNNTAVNDALSGTDKLTKKNYNGSTDEELMQACKQFEAYFIEQVYKGMEKTVPEEQFTSQSTGTLVKYYKDEMIKTMAEQTSDQEQLGLAQMLYEQMKRNTGVSAQEALQKSEVPAGE